MRLWHVIIILTSIWLVACDSNNSTYTYNQAEISLQDINNNVLDIADNASNDLTSKKWTPNLSRPLKSLRGLVIKT
jgi:hypothetical protein